MKKFRKRNKLSPWLHMAKVAEKARELEVLLRTPLTWTRNTPREMKPDQQMIAFEMSMLSWKAHLQSFWLRPDVRKSRIQFGLEPPARKTQPRKSPPRK